MNLRFYKNNQGFVLLFAVLMVSVVLTISLSLFNITYKQIILSSTGKDSQVAYNNAYIGLSCAKYWDRYYRTESINIVNATNYPFGKYGAFFTPGVRDDIYCAGQSVGDFIRDDFVEDVFTTAFNISFPGGGCSDVKITKNQNVYQSGSDDPPTTIRARGYNLDCNVTSSRKVERGVRADY